MFVGSCLSNLDSEMFPLHFECWKVKTYFIKPLHFLNIIFAKLSGEKSTGPGELIFMYYL